MSKRFLFPALRWPFFLFVALFFILVFLIFSGAVMLAFHRLGMPPQVAVTLFAFALVGSFINIPIAEEVTYEPVIRVRPLGFFGLVYPAPYFDWEERKTVIAVNVGGALIPLSVVIYEFIRMVERAQYGLLLNSLIAVAVASLFSNAVARPIRGLGIAMPSFFPPIMAVLLGWAFGDGNPTVVAYVSGTLGVLIGADLMNWGKIKGLGVPMVSIGGAGTFDGIFLAGVIAVLLV
ncbi:DUF1614 domain-containing protein [Thermococcus sp.]|uniref:DUF1614 domain-containing protein n=1 Tax=Thermococcus sp. TaxID=35749 RepID=UPI00261ED407|nr:DUF1614 domain-containing protein [Thermococcus sp.]